MAAFSARQLRQIYSPPPPRKPEAQSDELERLRRAAAEPAAPAVSRVVIAGVVRAIETARTWLTGAAIYVLYIVRNVGGQPGYFAVTIGVAAMAIVVFQSLHVYSAPAFRQPVARAVSHRRRLDR